MKSADDFTRFKTECKRQIGRLGLRDWGVTISHSELEGDDAESAAITEYKFSSKMAAISMNSKYKPENPERLAKHEVAHLFIARLQNIAEDRFATQKDIDECVEGIVTVLEKVL